MELGFYIIIFILIMLKLLIWVCVIYSRAQRRRRLMAAIEAAAGNPRVIIMERGPLNGHHNDYNAGVDNPALATWAPPSYEEAERMEVKPPPYEQVVLGPTGQQGSNCQPARSGSGASLLPNYSQVFSGQQGTSGNLSQPPLFKN